MITLLDLFRMAKNNVVWNPDRYNQDMTDIMNSINNLLSISEGDSGAENIGSAPIVGVAGATVYAQLVSLKAQIQSMVLGAIPDDTIETGMLIDGIVTALKLATDAVSTAKIQNNAVTTDKILNGAITAAKLSADLLAALASQSNLVSMRRTGLRLLLRQTSKFIGVNEWVDPLEDASWIDTGKSSGYALSGGKIIKLGYYDAEITAGFASEKYTGTATAPYNAFNSNPSDYTTFPSGGETAIIQLPAGKAIDKIVIDAANTYGSANGSYVIAASLNGSVWVDLVTDGINSRATKTHTFTNAVAYTYYRITASPNNPAYDFNVYSITFYRSVASATVIWQNQSATGTVTQAIIEAEQTLGSGSITYSISRDNGATFTEINVDTLTDISAQPSGTEIVLKAVLTGDAQLLGIAWGSLV